MACPDAAEPLKLIWTNNTLNADSEIVAPGIQVSIGTPSQNFSLVPTIVWDNVWVNSILQCGTGDNETCIQELGGVFQQDQSSSSTLTSLATWNGTQGNNFDFVTEDTFFNDVLDVDGTRLFGVPMYSQETIQGEPGRLPLGISSTFINSLVDAELVPSKSFGLWVGDNSQSMPGSLTIGGYLAELFEHPIINRTTGSDCPACLVVGGLVWRTEAGEIDLFADANFKAMQAKLEPSHPYLSLPKSAFKAFANATGGTESTQNTLLEYSSSNPPKGELVVTSNSGLTTSIPERLLFGPPAFPKGDDFSTDGSKMFALVEQYNSSISPDFGDQKNVGVLGIPYMSLIYLFRDYERQILSLGNVVPTAVEDVEVTKICPLPAGSSFSAPPGDGTSSTPTSVASPTSLPSDSSHSSTSAIIGGVIGGTAGIALIFLAAFFFMRRQRALRVVPQGVSSERRSSGWHRMPVPSVAGQSEYGTYNSISDSSGTLGPASSRGFKDPLSSPDSPHELPSVSAHPHGVPTTGVWEKPALNDTNRIELPANQSRAELP